MREEIKLTGKQKLDFIQDVTTNGYNECKNGDTTRLIGAINQTADEKAITVADINYEIDAWKTSNPERLSEQAERTREYLLNKFAQHAQAQSVAVAPSAGKRQL